MDAIATEQIKNSLDAIKENRTVVVISHSISQIIDSEIIFVLKKGRVVESGTHEKLYEKKRNLPRNFQRFGAKFEFRPNFKNIRIQVGLIITDEKAALI